MYQRRQPHRILASVFATVMGLALIALAGGVLLVVGATIDGTLASLTRPESTDQAQPTATPRAPGATSSARTTSPSASPTVPASDPGGTAEPTVDPSIDPSPEPLPSVDPPPKAGPFVMNLYRRGDFASQATKLYCVPAAMLTMINIISEEEQDRSSTTQRRLYDLARKLSPPTLKGAGAEPEGWARALNRLGHGPYAVDVRKSRYAAVKTAAIAIRMTGRPVGLLTWRGAHSWVMSGFKATADPARTDDFTVTHVYIEDVWYPRISSIWGASRPPNTLVQVDLLSEDYLPWRRPTGRYPAKDGRFVLVIPVE